jgi:glucosamine 6-phosphate synthetase-like amidotransferase/phosphosugar isomerase protein
MSAICEPGTLEQIEKGGYPHFMIKEIMEQPTSMANCMRCDSASDLTTRSLFPTTLDGRIRDVG